MLAWTAQVHARTLMRRFFRATRRGANIQSSVLMSLVRRHADSAFGQDHGFQAIRDVHDFRRQVPVRAYAQMAPYIDRVQAGEVTALFREGERILMFARTSGSTDQPKHIPVTPGFVRDYRRGWNIFGIKALLDHPGCFVRGIVQVASRMDEGRTATGVPCGAISGLLAATQKRLVRKYYVVPPETAEIADADARYYSIVRFAVPRDVAWMVTASPATPIHLARTAETHADRLFRDIHDGTLSPPGDTPPACLPASLRDRLTPAPRTARRLEAIASRTGRFRPRDYWRLGFLANWTGGTLGLHLREFPEYFGDTPVRDIGLLATEGRVTFGIEDRVPYGLLDVQGAFFEFLPAREDPPMPDGLDPPQGNAPVVSPAAVNEALGCHELDIGATYRVILTNSAGLYRYDLGDFVRVAGYVGQAPLLEFLHRGERVSSMTGEKLTEWQAVEAYQRACAELNLPGALFVLCPQWRQPPRYRLHVDARDMPLARLAERVDHHLSALNLEYAAKRKSLRLGPIEPNSLPTSFLAERDARLKARRGAANEQFKRQCLYTQPGEDDDFPSDAREAGAAVAQY